MPVNPQERCTAVKRDGAPCRRFQVYPDGFCIQHHRKAVKAAEIARLSAEAEELASR